MHAAFIATTLSLLSVSSTDAFVSGAARLPMSTSGSRTGAASMAMNAEPRTRKALIQEGALSIAGLVGLTAMSQPASAGLFGGEKQWAGVIDPRSAVKDVEKMATDAVKSNISEIKRYQSVTKEISDQLANDPQADLLPKIKDNFKFAQFRQTLNELNDVFDEDTQRGTDLIIRNMLQDALELANAAKLKAGVPRSDRKLEILQKKLQKLELAFNNLNAFL